VAGANARSESIVARTRGNSTVETSPRSCEFTSTIGEKGEIVIPDTLLGDYGLQPGTRVHVRLTDHALAARLRERGITEDEIQRIAGLQLESREQVVKFLLSESALHGVKDVRQRNRGARRR
jgi:bifunctional DNA-binding transcriptional regulator/antitoxin component of YhaV-PrlF toxin-antitoxin module